MTQSNRPDFSTPQGLPTSAQLAEAAFSGIPAGMRELTAEEERAAIPLPKKEEVKRERPIWIPQELDFSALPEEMREQIFGDIHQVVDESPIQSDALIELQQEIEAEQAQANPTASRRRRSSFAQEPLVEEQAVTYEEREQYTFQQAVPTPVTVPHEVHPPMTPAPRHIPEAPMQQAPRPVPPQPRMAPPAPKQQAPTVKQHPVFASLMHDFGIQNDFRSESYKGHKFTFKQYNAEQNTFCISLADTLSSSAMEYSERIRQNLVCVSLVAIDDTPIYEILGRTPTELGYILQDRLNIPSKMSMLLVEPLRSMFLETFSPSVIIDLWSIYDRLFPSSVITDPGEPSEERWRYKCPVKGCTHSIDEIPAFGSDGMPQRFFCPVHGNELNILGPVADLENVPLA